MQSKQKTRTQPRKQKKQRAASNAPARRAPRSRPAKGPRTTARETRVAPPVAFGTIRQSGTRLRFGAAAPHNRYPEGGLRLSCMVPSYFQLYCPDSSNLGMISNSHYQYVAISPSGNYANILASNVSTAFDGAGTFTSLCGSFAEYRIRQLKAHYVPLLGTNTYGTTNAQTTVQMTYFHDVTDDSVVTQAIRGSNGTSVSFPIWEPCSVEIIRYMKPDRADDLYKIGPIGDLTGDAAVAVQQIQGNLSIIASSLGTSSSDFPAADLWFEMVVDLYEFRSYWSFYNPQLRDKGDKKKTAEEPDYISLTPRKSSAPLRVEVPDSKRPDPPASTRVPSKK